MLAGTPVNPWLTTTPIGPPSAANGSASGTNSTRNLHDFDAAPFILPAETRRLRPGQVRFLVARCVPTSVSGEDGPDYGHPGTRETLWGSGSPSSSSWALCCA